MRIHPAPRFFVNVGLKLTKHPCASDGPAATIAAYRQFGHEEDRRRLCPNNGTRDQHAINPNCAAARAWRNMSRADELLLSSTDGAQLSPELLSCARRMPTSITTTFWANSWKPRFLEDRNRSRHV